MSPSQNRHHHAESPPSMGDSGKSRPVRRPFFHSDVHGADFAGFVWDRGNRHQSSALAAMLRGMALLSIAGSLVGAWFAGCGSDNSKTAGGGCTLATCRSQVGVFAKDLPQAATAV